MAEPYYFGRRPERNQFARLTRAFEVRCLCGGTEVFVTASFEDGEAGVFLNCKRCKAREELPIK